MRASARRVRLLGLCALFCVNSQLSAQGFSRGGEVVEHYLKTWEWIAEWWDGERLPPGYRAGTKATLVTFWTSELHGYCSCELQECHLIGTALGEHRTEPGTPCVAFGEAVRLLADFSRPERRGITITTVTPGSPPYVEPTLAWDRDLMFQLDQAMQGEMEPGRNLVAEVLAPVCADIGSDPDTEGPCSESTQFREDLYIERVEVALPDLTESRRAKLAAANPTAAVESIVSYVRGRRAELGKPETGPCAPSKLTLPRFLESDDVVLGYSQMAKCGYEIIMFDRSRDDGWFADGAVENTRSREIFREKILDNVLVTITFE